MRHAVPVLPGQGTKTAARKTLALLQVRWPVHPEVWPLPTLFVRPAHRDSVLRMRPKQVKTGNVSEGGC